MKISLVSESVWPESKGGIERWFDTLSRFLVAKGHEVTFFNSSSVSQLRDGTQYQSVSRNSWQYVSDGKRSKLQALQFGFYVFRALKKQPQEIIYCSSIPIISVLAVALVPKRILIVEWFEIWSLKYWIRYSGLAAGIVGWLIQLIALQIGDHRLVYSDRGMKSLSMLGKLNSQEIVKLPGLCPRNRPINFDVKNKDRINFYFLSRFVAEKQPFLAIDSARRLRESGWTGKMWLLGTGPLYENLKKYVKGQNLENFVEVIENPSDEEVKRIMETCCALLHPSRREGFGLAPVEAAYSGLPTILINYPDNAAVELRICPELVVENPSIYEIVSKMKLAILNQAQFRNQVLAWSRVASTKRGISKTLETIEGILNITRNEKG